MIILASASPRRIELLKKLTKNFSVEPSNILEGSLFSNPKKVVMDIAKKKAQESRGDIVFSADTTVFRGGKFYGKPLDSDDAFKIISELNGKWHTVYTGVCVRIQGKFHMFCASSRVKFKRLEKERILGYIKEYKPFDKAGAYGIQDDFIVEKYRGSLSNIMGLPLEMLEKKLKKYEKKYGVKILD